MKKLFPVLLYVITASHCLAGQSLSPPYTCTTTICQPGGSNIFETPWETQKKGPPGKRGGLGPKGDKGDPCHCDVLDEAVMESLREEWRNKVKEYDNIRERLKRLEDLPENCSISRNSRHGEEGVNRYEVLPIYPLKFIGDVTPWIVNCTKILSDGMDGWIPIQRRQDGGTDFYRNWQSYAKGFGNRQEEFWLGLRQIHKMTTTKSCKLRIDMKAFGGTTAYAEYSTFQVANEESLFRLTISGYSGDTHDSMRVHNGQAFSTMDRENDLHASVHCAKHHSTPWWHRDCYQSSLNGIYYKTVSNAGDRVRWYDGSKWIQLHFVEMKLFCH